MVVYENGYAYIDGYKFRKDNKSGYYLSTKNIGSSRKRLHVYVWEKDNGLVPKGFHVHHKDSNKDNNDLGNLLVMTPKEHLSLHGEYITEERKVVMRKNLDKARVKASEWHKSEEGLAWHKKQSKFMLDKRKKYDTVCKMCGIEYVANNSNGKFCTPKCRSAYRRASGVDSEMRLCIGCGGKFKTNKYGKVKHCSLLCANRSKGVKQ